MGGHAGRARSAPHLALLHPVEPHQPCLGQRLDPLRLQGAEPCGGDGLLDRGACHRRRRPPHRARRCRCHGRRRHRGGDLPARRRRLPRPPRPPHPPPPPPRPPPPPLHPTSPPPPHGP